MTEDIKHVTALQDELNKEILKRKKMEKEQARLYAELTAKNRELEQIVYVTSHDLRSPLVNISGFSKEIGTSLDELKLLLHRKVITADVNERISYIIEKDIADSLRFIITSASKMDFLIGALLNLSRLGRAELKPRPLYMNKLISDIINSLKFQAKSAGARIYFSDMPVCSGDESQINQVFFNLIGNALKYLSPERPGIVNISGHIEDGQSVYCVEDNGTGIAPGHQEKIFEIFYQLEPGESAGEGLGLTIVRKIIERHHGKIWLESEKGKGSKFYVSLPT